MTRPGDCKVDTAIERYGLEDPQYDSVDEGLLARWLGEDGHGEHGYRTLTAWFNKRVLRTAYEDHGRKSLGNRIEADYEALTGDDELVRQEVEADIRADGIDVAELTGSLVSWGTMRTHLTECLDAEKSTASGSSDWQRDAIEMARSFATEKVEGALSSLATDGEFDGADDVSVDVEVRLRCDECPTVVPFDVAVRRGYVCEQHHREQSAVSTEQR